MMHERMGSTMLRAGLVSVALAVSPVQAQLGDLMKQDGGGLPGGLGNVGGVGGAVSGASMTSGSLGNVAGLLEFCIRNNYLGGKGVASVKDSLVRKLPGGSSSTDSAYASGRHGILQNSSGGQFDLAGGGMKKEVTRQICDKVLAQGKSML